MEIVALAAKIISWCVFLLGTYCDVFSLYCTVRKMVNPRFRTSSMPCVGLLLYLIAASLGFANKSILLIFCCLDILTVMLSFMITRRVWASMRKREGDKQ